MHDAVGKCNICNNAYTETSVDIDTEYAIFVCADCIGEAKDNFIWLCITCGKTYIKPKDLVINKIKDHELKKAYMLCQDLQIIQGIDTCIACHPERIIEYMELQYADIEC